ncbi:MAG: hypothetical protein CMG75_07285 [Candidatus Marinimicrobia bacterium]|nr:hypothetical protein [Candidatus Neomarinimicrobiota bacterium]|tara:strand:+ start:23256 stop:23492 length:237 start_codon:yes stop_codon:yes gene_type:complete
MKSSFSKRLGELLAHLQDLFDSLLHFGFKRVSESEKNNKSKNKKFNKFLKFLGEIGQSYFNKYDELKTKNNGSPNHDK